MRRLAFVRERALLDKKSFLHKARDEGLEEGLAKGREEGVTSGQRHLIRTLLQQRFGELPDWAEARLAAATPEQLQAWGARLLSCKALENLFES